MLVNKLRRDQVRQRLLLLVPTIVKMKNTYDGQHKTQVTGSPCASLRTDAETYSYELGHTPGE